MIDIGLNWLIERDWLRLDRLGDYAVDATLSAISREGGEFHLYW